MQPYPSLPDQIFSICRVPHISILRCGHRAKHDVSLSSSPYDCSVKYAH